MRHTGWLCQLIFSWMLQGKRRREDVGNETCAFSLMTQFVSCSSLEMNKEPGKQKRPNHVAAAAVFTVISNRCVTAGAKRQDVYTLKLIGCLGKENELCKVLNIIHTLFYPFLSFYVMGITGAHVK